jgi:hypothetical protein
VVAVGKRFTCGTCGSQVMVIKAGDAAELSCCEGNMSLEEPKQVASSD